MAWDRYCELSIGESAIGLLISDLDIEFEIQKSMKLSENFAQFKIYNAQLSTRNDILKQGNNVTFAAGYRDEGNSTIFIGQIIRSISKKISCDWVSDIVAVTSRGKLKKIDTIPLTLSFAAQSILSTIISQLAATLGLVVAGIENANIILSNGWVYQGTTGGALRYIQNILRNEGKDLYFNDDELVIYNIGIPSKFEIVRLAYSGGLLSIEDITEPPKESQGMGKRRNKIKEVSKRVRFETILIPQLQLNAPINVFGTDQDGTYIVEKLSFVGDNFGGDYVCRGEAIA